MKKRNLQEQDARMPQYNDKKNLIAQINIADDYFKAKKQVEVLEESIAARDKEIFDLKHNLIDMQRKLDEMKKK